MELDNESGRGVVVLYTLMKVFFVKKFNKNLGFIIRGKESGFLNFIDLDEILGCIIEYGVNSFVFLGK